MAEDRHEQAARWKLVEHDTGNGANRWKVLAYYYTREAAEAERAELEAWQDRDGTRTWEVVRAECEHRKEPRDWMVLQRYEDEPEGSGRPWYYTYTREAAELDRAALSVEQSAGRTRRYAWDVVLYEPEQHCDLCSGMGSIYDLSLTNAYGESWERIAADYGHTDPAEAAGEPEAVMPYPESRELQIVLPMYDKHEHGLYVSWKIRFCPMCGRRINE
jgi:hypothetical protein